jgi:hypothetical protein
MESLLSAARSWVDQIHLNASFRDERQGRAVFVKRRRLGSGLVMRLANVFFRLARNPVEAITDRGEWRQWEVNCFTRLHGPEFSAGTDPNGTTWIDVMPGESLSAALATGTLQPAMLMAAGKELRRAHAQACPHYQNAWSHGDPHSGNFLYDDETGRARLIDFEVRHLRHLRSEDRHADDVLVLLQDVCGRCRADQWPDLAAGLLDGYGRPEITARIREKLRIPNGIPRLWWAVRTTWMHHTELEKRMAQLAALLPA